MLSHTFPAIIAGTARTARDGFTARMISTFLPDELHSLQINTALPLLMHFGLKLRSSPSLCENHELAPKRQSDRIESRFAAGRCRWALV